MIGRKIRNPKDRHYEERMKRLNMPYEHEDKKNPKELPRRLCPDCDGTGVDLLPGDQGFYAKIECPQCKGRGAQVWRPNQQKWEASQKRDTDRFDNGDST
tara:strand:+ start:546 stop:845 length:300 start_codon:yes stop_codon:yes gene_type:complete